MMSPGRKQTHQECCFLSSLSELTNTYDTSHTSISVLQGQTHLDDLNTELIVEVTYTQHFRPKSFSSYKKTRLKSYSQLYIYSQRCNFALNQKLLTGERIDSNGGAHFLKLNPELGVLSDFLFMFARKLLQVGLEGLQLLGHLARKQQRSKTNPQLCRSGGHQDF